MIEKEQHSAILHWREKKRCIHQEFFKLQHQVSDPSGYVVAKLIWKTVRNFDENRTTTQEFRQQKTSKAFFRKICCIWKCLCFFNAIVWNSNQKIDIKAKAVKTWKKFEKIFWLTLKSQKKPEKKTVKDLKMKMIGKRCSILPDLCCLLF